MPLYTLRKNTPIAQDGKGFDWELVGGVGLTALGLGLATFGLAKKDPLGSIAGVALAGGGGYVLYRRQVRAEEVPEVPPEVPEAEYVITHDRYATPFGEGEWQPT